MPKMKTHKAAVKRFKLTRNGKAIHQRAYGNHLLEKKSPDRKRDDSKNASVSSADYKNVKKQIGR